MAKTVCETIKICLMFGAGAGRLGKRPPRRFPPRRPRARKTSAGGAGVCGWRYRARAARRCRGVFAPAPRLRALRARPAAPRRPLARSAPRPRARKTPAGGAGVCGWRYRARAARRCRGVFAPAPRLRALRARPAAPRRPLARSAPRPRARKTPAGGAGVCGWRYRARAARRCRGVCSRGGRTELRTARRRGRKTAARQGGGGTAYGSKAARFLRDTHPDACSGLRPGRGRWRGRRRLLPTAGFSS